MYNSAKSIGVESKEGQGSEQTSGGNILRVNGLPFLNTSALSQRGRASICLFHRLCDYIKSAGEKVWT